MSQSILREFPISLWIFGDETSKDFLNEWLSPLPPREQIEQLMKLPHFQQMEFEMHHYRFVSEEQAIKRYRNELGDFKRRNKLKARAKNRK